MAHLYREGGRGAGRGAGPERHGMPGRLPGLTR